jgi:peptide/nickel transport system substrate-binding protein
MKKSLFYFITISVFLVSCSTNSGNMGEEKAAKGGRVYGGVVRINETEIYSTLFPIAITDIGSSHIASQIFEGLVKFNSSDLAIKPCLAETWEIDASGTVYTFHLKKGVMFQDNDCFEGGKGRELKASDFEYSFELLCTDSKENASFFSTFKNRVLGANKFFEANKDKPKGKIDGVKVLDDYTLSITLTAPSSSFLYSLALPGASVIAKEAYEKYGINVKVGTGPFVFDENAGDDKVVLRRNKNYHGQDTLGNKLPFLDSIVVSFLPTKMQELDKFKNGYLDMIVGFSAEAIKDMVETQISDFAKKAPKYILECSPEMSTQYYEFNLSKVPFSNINVRKAFSYAINRNKIIEDVLKGEAFGSAIYGICPPSFKGYDITKITGYNFDPAKAKKYFADAGYPNGKGFPKIKIELNSGGSVNSNVVLEIQKQLLDVLNINVDFEIVPQKQKLEDEKYFSAEMFHASWVADFPNPENFLWIFYGPTVPLYFALPSYPNHTRYKNAEFDKLFEAGKSAKTKEESFANFLKAEQVLMNDAPIMVLWYGEDYRLSKSSVRNFHSNPMRLYDYSQVYIQEVVSASTDKKEEKK